MSARYVGQRMLQTVFVLWIATTLAFVAYYVTPGDPAQALLAASGATPEEVESLRDQLGLDEPFLSQYSRYLIDLVQFKLGRSWLHGRPVQQIIWEQYLPTLELAVSATAVGVGLGVALGIIAAFRQRSWLDSLVTSVAVLGISIPTYWSGLAAIFIFSLHLRWLPATGEGSLRHLILPALVLGFALSGSIARVVRARFVEILGEPFVTAARARGLPAWRVLWVHTLRAAIGPALTVAALQFGFLLGGAVITESVFARRGLGHLMLEAIRWQDLPVVRGLAVMGALSYVLTNLAADLLHAWFDPRLRESAP